MENSKISREKRIDLKILFQISTWIYPTKVAAAIMFAVGNILNSILKLLVEVQLPKYWFKLLIFSD